jgi:hypothetical protein
MDVSFHGHRHPAAYTVLAVSDLSFLRDTTAMFGRMVRQTTL